MNFENKRTYIQKYTEINSKNKRTNVQLVMSQEVYIIDYVQIILLRLSIVTRKIKYMYSGMYVYVYFITNRNHFFSGGHLL